MRATFSITEGLTLTFPRSEDAASVALLQSMLEMYTEQGQDASPIQLVIEAIREYPMVGMQ